MNRPPDGGAGRTTESDEFVERLGDRLSQPHALPPDQMVLPVVSERETSDVHELADLGADDEALEVPPEPDLTESADVFADFEDELESETTRIDDSNLLAEQSTSILENVPARPFLEVERGKDQGREFVLQEGENGVGRGIDNDVILTDVAVSRRHLKLVCTAAGLTMRDLGSGNGTLVNGTKVSTIELSEGDRIELGETTLVVRLPGASLSVEDPYVPPDEATDEQNITSGLPAPGAFDGTPADPLSIPNGPGYQPELTPSGTARPGGASASVPRGSVVLPKPLVIFALVGGALLLAISAAALAALAISSTGGDDEPSVVVGAPSHFDRGLRAYNSQQWNDAAREFRAALEAEGEDDAEVQGYLSRAELAIQDQPSIDRASRLLEQGDLASASQAAAAVRDTNSPLFPTAQRLIGEIRQDQALRAANEGSQALRNGDVAEARRQLGLATGFAPESAAVRQLRAQIGQRTGEATQMPSEATETPPSEATETPPSEAPPTAVQAPAAPARPRARTGTGRAPRRVGRGGGRQTSRRDSVATDTTRAIIAQYLAGNFTQAASMADAAAGSSGVSARDRARLVQLARNIRAFGGLWPQIQRANFSSRVSQQMSQAMALDGRIANNPRYRSQLRGRLVTLHLAEARRRSDPVRRCYEVQLANQIDPRNADVQRASHQCEVVARGMMAGAAQQPVARRATIYSQVRRMVPRNSDLANDAARRAEQSRRQTRPYDDDE